MSAENPVRNSDSFVHLHAHSQYSLLEATCRFSGIAKKCAEYGMPAAAITDNGNMFGAVEFYFACKDAGLKAILGMDVYLSPKSRFVKGEDREAAQTPNRRLVLLAQDYEGYRNLCQLSTIGYQEGFYYKPRVDFEAIKQFSSNLIVLSGGSRGDVPWHLEKHGPDAALARIREYQAIFGDRFYLEMNRTGPEWTAINEFLVEASKITGSRLVAANNVHYLEQSDQLAQEVLICIGSNKTLQDESRYRLGSDQFYFKSAKQMRELFRDRPDACDATLEIAERCDVKFKLKDERGKAIYHLPTFATDEGRATPQELIRKLAFDGLTERFAEAAERGEAVADEKKPDYEARLEYELDVIEKMGFTSYFLIVQDFINWAKTNGIPVGPGRGSGAGSLCAYCLRITDLDPVRYALIFERFLNPERISMPDFDIDFCQDKRPLVIDYVTQKYGSANVSQIITYGKLQARAALRDVGRVLGMTYAEVDVISKLMPEKLGITLDEALEIEPRLKEQMELNPQIQTMMDLARKVEGLVRHAGIHAAGVVIASDALVKYAPLYRGANGENVVQFDMKWAEKIGLIKFDFLGLKTLTHIQNALDLIEKNRGKKILPNQIPLSDPGIYEIMSRGDTAGIFQFEGEGITDAIRKIKPKTFEDITAINALYRPGPMDMIPEYTRRMHGETEVEYLFPELEPLLKETYGIIIYQEQVMSIASRIASYTLGEADMLRRAMGKKIASEMEAQKERFLRGAKANGFDATKAEQLFDLMQEFANYGFNKSHAAAYCVVAAQTAWLKNYYPVEFYAALLSTEMSDTDNVVKYVKDARARGIETLPPHVSRSEYKFAVQGESIVFSLGAIKGVGEGAVDAIVEARASLPAGEFKSLSEFFEAVDPKRMNKKTIECLIKAGALDDFPDANGGSAHRAQLMAGFEKFLERADAARRDREVGQGSLFAMIADPSAAQAEQTVTLEEAPAWTRVARLAYEKEVLGFYLSDHPLAGLDGLYKNWTTSTIGRLKDADPGKRAVVAGIVSSLREIISKKGSRMAFGQLEDLTGSVELIVFPEAFAKNENDLKDERPLLVGGKLEREGDACKILVDRVGRLDDVLKKSKLMTIRLSALVGPMPDGAEAALANGAGDKLETLSEVLRKHPGGVKVGVEIELPELRRVVTLDLEDGVEPTSAFFDEVQGAFGRADFMEIRS